MRIFASERQYSTEAQKWLADFALPRRDTGFTSPNAAITNNPVFSNDADRKYFLGLLESRSEEREVRIAAPPETKWMPSLFS